MANFTFWMDVTVQHLGMKVGKKVSLTEHFSGDVTVPAPPGLHGADPGGGGAHLPSAEAKQAESRGGPVRKVAFDISLKKSLVIFKVY